MARRTRRGDIDSTYNALRPRLGNLPSSGGSYVPPTTVPPHTHSADQIVMIENVSQGGYLAADDVQEGLEELDSEKLARSGEQTMLGDLDMNSHEIDNITNLNMNGGIGAAILNLVRRITMTGLGLIEAVRKIDFTGSVATEGIIDQPRVIHMAGDHADDEAKVDGLERVVFNDEPTASSIEQPSRLDMNVGVEAGVSYTAEEGRASWDTLEDTMVFFVQSGTGVVAVAIGWGVLNAVNGSNPV